jgi:hypothetical protein
MLGPVVVVIWSPTQSTPDIVLASGVRGIRRRSQEGEALMGPV